MNIQISNTSLMKGLKTFAPRFKGAHGDRQLLYLLCNLLLLGFMGCMVPILVAAQRTSTASTAQFFRMCAAV